MRTKLLCMMVIFGLAGAAQAMDAPKVSYSADQSMETADGTMKGKVYVTPTMERRETDMDGQQSVMIMRRDKKVAWTLMPSEEMYMESKMANTNQPGDMAGYKIEESKTMGHEVVNGIPCEKRKLIMSTKDGTKMGGFSWVSKEGIVVKMDMLAKEQGSKMRIKNELTNLKVGEQDPSLFEIPKGYSRMDMPGMPGMGGGGMNMKDMLKYH